MSQNNVQQIITEAETAPAETSSQAIERLAQMSPIEYDQVRATEAKQLGIRVTTLDNLVEECRLLKTQSNSNSDSMFKDIEPFPESVAPLELFNELRSTIKKFIICDDETAIAATLWIVFTWFIDDFHIAPLAVITAPEKRCGKTQLLNVIGHLSRKPLTASNVSPAALFRVIEAHNPTLLIDEADTFLKDNKELRGIINSGHSRDNAYVIRTVGEDHTPTRFGTFGAKAISGIGVLPDTLMDRAVILELRRKKPSENVERMRYAEQGLFKRLASKLARFALDERAAVAACRPKLPNSLNDRAQDNWEPLLSLADIAGGDWPELARKAAITISGKEREAPSLSTELLADIQEVFDRRKAKGVPFSDRISTTELLRELTQDELAPWATYNRSSPMSPRQLAKRLDDYKIKAKGIRIGTATPKGFMREQFEDAFARYLAHATATPQQNEELTTVSATNDVADKEPVAATQPPSATPNYSENLECCTVAENYEDADFQERAAIYEYDGGYSREDAEQMARDELK